MSFGNLTNCLGGGNLLWSISSSLSVSISPPTLQPFNHSLQQSHAPFVQHQELQPLGRLNGLCLRRVIVSYSQLIKFVRLDSEYAQSDGKSMNQELPV